MTKKTAKRTKYSANYALKLTVAIFSAFLLFIGLTVYFNLKEQASCANAISCIKDLSGKKENINEGVFMGKKVNASNEPTTPVFALEKMRNVLGASTGNNKHIYVDLTNQRLYAYEGNKLVYNFLISSGKWHPTPTGDFHIWVWLRYTRMTGGDKAKGTFYDLPNVPYTMFFANDTVPRSDGYSLHGAYWHNNFGHPMSHGCVNMKTDEVMQIFYWTNPGVKSLAYPTTDNPGTLITIYGVTPAAETSYID